MEDDDEHRRVGVRAALIDDLAESGPSSRCSSPAAGPGGPRHVRSGSFQRWRRQMQKAWRWGPTADGNVDNYNDSGGGSQSQMNSNYKNDGGNREQGIRSSWNLELLANQKRQWYQIQMKAKDNRQYKEPASLFEHFFIVGLHSHANVEAIEDAFARRKTWESEVARSEILDLRKIQSQARVPTLEPQILFKYPPGKQVAMRESDIPSFCFPEGVKARMLERTQSMSDLNELVFGQEHLARDDLSFIFRLKVADNATLYGVCLHVQEIVQRAPGILA